MATIRDKLLALKKRFKHVTKNRCFYNDPDELEKASNQIITWSIIESNTHGIFIFEFPFRRKQDLTFEQWSKYWKKSGKERYSNLHKILVDIILGNISAKYNDEWRFIELIGWTMRPYGVHKLKNRSPVPKDKPSKKRKK